MKLVILTACALATLVPLAGPARAGGAAKLDWDRFFGMTEAQLAAVHAPFTAAPARDRNYVTTLYGQQADALLFFQNGHLDRIAVSAVGRNKVRAIRDGLLRAYNVVLDEPPPEHACATDGQWVGVEAGALPYEVFLLGLGPQCPEPNTPVIQIILQSDRAF